MLIFTASGAAQTQQKVLQWSDHPTGSHNERTAAPNQIFKQLDAIEIQSINLGGKSIAIGEPFSADEDWLRDLTFRVKNVSDKDLMGIQITLILPELKKPIQVPYVRGCRHDKNQPCIRPGEEVEIRIAAIKLYDWVKSVVATETELRNITKAAIYHVLVSLPGDITWSSGCVKTKDPRQACPEHVH
ncbi:MAG TPA: hypothetical protein VGW32_09865 [Pyrinomonadaceae bacterium]|nr:hypothetical protein [Pyrinomonadaceae bacterium]